MTSQSAIDLGTEYSDAMQEFWRRPVPQPFGTASPPSSVDSDWVEHRSGLPWLQLNLDLPYRTMADEALQLLGRFAEHRGSEGHGWRSLCLHGIDAEKTRSPRHYGYTEENAPYRWTDVADSCPATVRFFKEQYPLRRLFRVRFMLLEPGGFIAPHHDTSTHYLSAVNIALTNPEGAYFKMRDVGCVPFQPGRAFWLDVGHEHSCVNLSTLPRIHIIVHGEDPSPAWDALVVQSYRDRVE